MEIFENGQVTQGPETELDHHRDFINKKHLVDLPVIDKPLQVWNYTHNDTKETAIIYPTFIEEYPISLLYIKATLYSALSLITKTDIVDAGIPIFFAMAEKKIDIIAPYLATAGVPESHIITYNHPNDLILFNKNAAVDAVTDYTRIFSIDADIFVRGNGQYEIAKELQWNTKEFDITSALFHEHDEILFWEGYLKEAEQHPRKAQKFLKNDAYKTIQTYYPKHLHYYINTAFVGYTQHFRKNPTWQKFLKTFQTYAEEINSGIGDEEALIIYLHENPETLAKTMQFPFKYIIDVPFSSSKPYIHHIHKAIEYKQWKTEWLAEMEDLLYETP